MERSLQTKWTNPVHGFVITIWFLTVAITCFSQQSGSFRLLKKEIVTIDNQQYVLLRGELTVAENRNERVRTLSLPVQIIKARKATGEPIFWLDGGPGATNLLSAEKIISASPGKLLATHDFVCVGYRGVDGSVKLQSRKINKAFRSKRYPLLSEESIDRLARRIKQYSLHMRKKGIDLNCYTIPDVIDDIEDARKALGYPTLSLLATSYGARVALLYHYRFPATIKRTLMIGACPPGYFLTRPEQAEKTINFYDSLYQTSAKRPYPGFISTAIEKSFRELPKRWAFFRLDPDKIKAGTIAMLYARGSSVWAFNAYFRAAYEKDFSQLYMLQKIYEMNRKMVIGDIYTKTVSADMERGSAKILSQPPFQDSGTLLGNNVSSLYGSTAHVWSLTAIAEQYKKCRTIEADILVISGDLDFRTPPDITTRELMPYLKNGRHLILKNMSHSDILLNVMKSPEFVYQYFEFGRADSSQIKQAPSVDFTSTGKLGKLKIFVAGLIL